MSQPAQEGEEVDTEVGDQEESVWNIQKRHTALLTRRSRQLYLFLIVVIPRINETSQEITLFIANCYCLCVLYTVPTTSLYHSSVPDVQIQLTGIRKKCKPS